MSRSQHHPNHPGVDQSDRPVPGNPRQTGDPDVDLVISTRVRKSPFRHRSVGEGRHETVYNHMYHPRAYIDSEDGGAEAEYDLLVNHLITRDGTDVEPMRGKCAICCNQDGGILDDFALLCPDDEVRFSIAGSDLTAGARERATIHAKADTDE
jgi:aminomethyltransferase